MCVYSCEHTLTPAQATHRFVQAYYKQIELWEMWTRKFCAYEVLPCDEELDQRNPVWEKHQFFRIFFNIKIDKH